MSWRRGSSLAALLVILSPLASADSITVNTTTDDNASNTLCSLREAVEYFNRGKPDGGWQGCVRTGSASSTDAITIPANTAPYVVSGTAIPIRTDLSITGAGSTGTSKTVIQATGGAHRLFIINDSPVYIPPPCNTTHTCAPAGGPDLDAASNPTSNYLTSAVRPTFTGSVTPPSGTDVVDVTLHDDLNDTDIGVAELTSSSSGTWAITSLFSLVTGVHSIVATIQTYNVTTNPDGTKSRTASGPATTTQALTFALYALPPRRTVAFSQLELQGCFSASVTDCANDADDNASLASYTIINDPASASYDPKALSYSLGLSNTTGNGGILYLNELATFDRVKIDNGGAQKGGAAYADTDGGIKFLDSEISGNTAAVAGGALYLEHNAVILQQVLVSSNTVGNSTGAIIKTGDGAVVSGLAVSQILNTTVSGNTGVALSLHDSATVNAATIVLNSGGGIDFNAEKVSVYSTILAGNPDSYPGTAAGFDCINLPATPDVVASLSVVGGGCDGVTGMSFIFNDGAAGHESEKLMATLDASNKCTSQYGLLCPLADNGGDTRTHLVRVLTGYVQLTDSPIINKGASSSASSSACPDTDQRGDSRLIYACDIGAFEVQAVTGNVTSGGSIHYGQSYTQSMGDNLKDEFLLDPAQAACPATPPLTPVPNTYRSDVIGCPWLETAPSRGKVVFNLDGSYTYTPTPDFHGFDRFTIRVTTTLSRLNALPDSQSRLISVQVIDEPPSGITSSHLGVFDGWELGVLGLLGFMRMRRRGE